MGTYVIILVVGIYGSLDPGLNRLGSSTALGLWPAGVPLAFALGMIAGILAFIPNIGPIVALTPAALQALPERTTTLLVVMAIFLGVKARKSYAITPMVRQDKVSLPSELVIAAQLLFGVLFGFMGLMLATPIAAGTLTVPRLVFLSRTILSVNTLKGQQMADEQSLSRFEGTCPSAVCRLTLSDFEEDALSYRLRGDDSPRLH